MSATAERPNVASGLLVTGDGGELSNAAMLADVVAATRPPDSRLVLLHVVGNTIRVLARGHSKILEIVLSGGFARPGIACVGADILRDKMRPFARSSATIEGLVGSLVVRAPSESLTIPTLSSRRFFDLPVARAGLTCLTAKIAHGITPRSTAISTLESLVAANGELLTPNETAFVVGGSLEDVQALFDAGELERRDRGGCSYVLAQVLADHIERMFSAGPVN